MPVSVTVRECRFCRPTFNMPLFLSPDDRAGAGRAAEYAQGTGKGSQMLSRPGTTGDPLVSSPIPPLNPARASFLILDFRPPAPPAPALSPRPAMSSDPPGPGTQCGFVRSQNTLHSLHNHLPRARESVASAALDRSTPWLAGSEHRPGTAELAATSGTNKYLVRQSLTAQLATFQVSPCLAAAVPVETRDCSCKLTQFTFQVAAASSTTRVAELEASLRCHHPPSQPPGCCVYELVC